jgi:hypothetical protein
MTIPDDQWRPIDEAIVANLKLKALQQIQLLNGYSLKEAIECLCKRYAKLRQDSPERFTCSHDDYWAEFYS